MSFVPTTAKAEFHLTYRCNLSCLSCSRGSWLKKPHTEDMTLEDAHEFFRQADEIGWKDKPRQHKERPRFIMMGGEPTLNPHFLEFVRLCSAWSGWYVQVYSNGHTPKTRELLEEAFVKYAASINKASWKTESVAAPEHYDEATWWWETFVSPADAGLPSPVCYVHPSQICGLSVDHEGYAMCPIGGSVRALLGMPRTKRLADLFDPEIAARMTAEECAHCGYEYSKRELPGEIKAQFAAYASTQPMTKHGCHMSPTWQPVFEDREPKPNLPYKHLPVL